MGGPGSAFARVGSLKILLSGIESASVDTGSWVARSVHQRSTEEDPFDFDNEIRKENGDRFGSHQRQEDMPRAHCEPPKIDYMGWENVKTEVQGSADRFSKGAAWDGGSEHGESHGVNRPDAIVPHVCETPRCLQARSFARPRPNEVGQKFIGNIAIGRSVCESIFGPLDNLKMEDKERNAVEFAKKAAYLIFSPEDLIGHNVGGLNGQASLCRKKIECIMAELEKNFRATMLTMVPSLKVPWMPHAIVTGLNCYLRSARSNYGGFVYFGIYTVCFFNLLLYL